MCFSKCFFFAESQDKWLAYEAFNRISVPYSLLGLLDISLVRFQCQTFWGLISQCRFQGFGCLMKGMNPSLIREKLCICEIPHDCGSLQWVWDFWQDHISASLVLIWPFYPLLWRSFLACFNVLFRGNYSCRFDVSMGGGTFSIF